MAMNKPRKVQERAGVKGGADIAANSPTIYQGALVMLKAGVAIPAREGQGADNAAKAAEAATFTIVGIAEETVTPADKVVPYKSGRFLFENSAADPVTMADMHKPCFAVDDETVGRTNPANIRAVAGTIVGVESVGVWVRVGVA